MTSRDQAIIEIYIEHYRGLGFKEEVIENLRENLGSILDLGKYLGQSELVGQELKQIRKELEA